MSEGPQHTFFEFVIFLSELSQNTSHVTPTAMGLKSQISIFQPSQDYQ